MNISILYLRCLQSPRTSYLVDAVESVGGHLVKEGLLEPQPRLVVGQTLPECLHQQRLLSHRLLEVLVGHAAVLVLVHPLQRDLYQILTHGPQNCQHRVSTSSTLTPSSPSPSSSLAHLPRVRQFFMSVVISSRVMKPSLLMS